MLWFASNLVLQERDRVNADAVQTKKSLHLWVELQDMQDPTIPIRQLNS